ncbi:MAG: hypothetical protein P4M14_11360 [Gammaproteobacteria bacterium]|nr:hypothetical protein [Gammaproteobacteria bacterium]
MAATEPLCQIVGISSTTLSRAENYIIEVELFVRVCEELKRLIKSQNKDYYRLMKLSAEMENEMLDEILIRHVINDILVTEEYSLEGIACYTHTPEDAICDILAGKNPAPSLPLSRKIIELHRTVRPNLYREIMKKITSEYLAQV